MRKILLTMILLLLLHPGIVVLGQDDSDPTQTAARYLAAFYAGESVQPFLCATQTADDDDITFYAQQRADLGLTVDLSGLTYRIEEQTETTARVRIGGTLAIQIAGLDQPLELTAAQAQIGPFDLALEDGIWKICTPPTGPDVIARQFMTAAYGGDYAGAQNVLCEAQRGQLTEEAYNDNFADFVSGEAQMDLNNTVFTVTDQTDTEATVEMSGVLILTTHGSTTTYTVGELGFGPILLVNENGWKVCPVSSELEN